VQDFAWLTDSDTHWPRTYLSAPIGQHGNGSLGNVQLEGALSYQFPTGLSVGVAFPQFAHCGCLRSGYRKSQIKMNHTSIVMAHAHRKAATRG